jgi:hypothetical protein
MSTIRRHIDLLALICGTALFGVGSIGWHWQSGLIACGMLLIALSLWEPGRGTRKRGS